MDFLPEDIDGFAECEHDNKEYVFWSRFTDDPELKKQIEEIENDFWED